MTTIDWATEFDHFDPAYAQDPFTVWAALREACPAARSARFRGMWVPTRAVDIEAIARDPGTFSSRSPVVASYGAMSDFGITTPPISSDPPYHTDFRKLLLPFFSPRRTEALRPGIAAHADALLDAVVGSDRADLAVDYAQHIPVRVITTLLGIPAEDGDRFRGWIHQMLELGPTDIEAAGAALGEFLPYLQAQIEQRRADGAPSLDLADDDPALDLVSFLIRTRLGGRPLDDSEVFGGCLLLLVAGIDTTWSAIGSGIWHLAGHAEDQARLRAEPDLLPSAVEELLRAYAPVTMAREVVQDGTIAGCPVHAGDPVLLPFPAANRDPDRFDDPDTVRFDRSPNRHVAFGIGIHRCLGSHLARLEVSVALERLLARVPGFALADPAAVRWSTGQVRGPRTLPLALVR